MPEPVVEPIVVRTATAADAAAVSAVAVRTFPLACPPDTTTADIAAHIAGRLQPEHFAADIADPRITVLVAAAGAGAAERLVGYAMLVADEPPPDGEAGDRPVELRRIYVHPEHHGRAVAAALMTAAVARGAADGHDGVWLGTNQQNARALRFYAKHGFRIVGEKTFAVGSSVEHDHVLARPLGDARTDQ